MKQKVSVLVLGTAEWNAPIATNQHYIVRELARDTHFDIHYMESMALRRPQVTRADLARIAGRVRRALAPTRGGESGGLRRDVPDGVRITSTMVIPVHTGPARAVNRRLLYRQVADWLSHDGPRILLTYTPVTYGLERYADGAFYHCVDLLGTFPGIDPRLIDANEARLAAAGVVAIGTSRAVAEHLRRRGFGSPILWENVADVGVYEGASGAADERSGAVFAGNLTTAKLDVTLLQSVVDGGVDLALAGPLGEGTGPEEPLGRLMARQGVTYLGLLGPEDLASVCGRRAVGLVPYAVNEYTRGVSPLKVYEYLASGLPVVSTLLPGVHADGEDVFVSDADEFVWRTRDLAASGVEQAEVDRRVGKARGHSWNGRGRQFRELFDKALG